MSAWRSTLVSLFLLSGAALFGAPAAANQDGQLTLMGKVVMPDGSPAAGATVRPVNSMDGTPTIATTAAGRFQLRGVFGNGAPLHASSADGSHQTTLRIAAGAARNASASLIELRLAPASTHEVTVVSDGKPVEGAQVVCAGTGFHVEGLSDSQGKVTLRYPAHAEIREIVAWHPQLGVDGVRASEDGAKRSLDQMRRLSLRAPAPHTIRVVDTEGKGVGDLKLGVSVGTKDSDWIVSRSIDAARIQTGADGTATATWVPQNGLKYIDVDILDSDWKIDEIDRDRIAEGETTVHVRREQTVEGRLVMPDGASTEGVLITGFAFGPGDRGAIPYARARRDGRFTLRVASDHGYILGVVDEEWASDPWSGIIVRSDGTPGAEVTIKAYPATPLTVRVTRGAERRPVVDAWVEWSSRDSVEFPDKSGRIRHGTAGPRTWLKTDAKGVATTGVGLGQLEVRVASGIWDETRNLTVSSREPVEVEFHRPWLGERKVSGRLTLEGKAYRPSSKLVARAWSERSPYMPLRFEPVVEPDGSFRVGFDAENVSLLFVDPENRLSGFATFDKEEFDLEVAMRPTAAYRGTLVDANSEPLAGRTVRLWAAIDCDAADPQQTDDLGRFHFRVVPTGLPLELRLENDPYGAQYYVSSSERLFQPGEARHDETITARRFDAGRRAAPAPSKPLAEALANICRSAALSRMHGLAVLEGDNSTAVLAGKIVDDDELKVVLHYLTVSVTPEQLKTEAEILQKLGWPLPAAGEIVLVALDGDQQTIATARISGADEKAALKMAAEFLEQHKPPTEDALALLQAARNEAKESGRRVWFVVGGPRCGPCFRLARWMDDHHATLEKDFVIVKAMGAIDDNVEKAVEGLPRKEFGIPWHAITEPDGTVLVTSEGPLGNIGMPSSVEGIRHLRHMLQTTARKLTADEIDALAQSLSQKPQDRRAQ
jgi:hypothetical protein